MLTDRLVKSKTIKSVEPFTLEDKDGNAINFFLRIVNIEGKTYWLRKSWKTELYTYNFISPNSNLHTVLNYLYENN